MKHPIPLRPENMHELVAERVHDMQLRGNIKRAVDISLHKRADVVSDFGDWENMRKMAHAVKALVIDHLAHYLAMFESRAVAAGAIVHFASDAEEARTIVRGLIQDCNGRLVVKSKSMTTEEIELTHALEEAGITCIETDLGEYIVQLAGEIPSHITAPALHKNRREIGLLFSEKLSVPYTDDPKELSNIAREKLRAAFMEADVGISGVNFAIAESGTICIVENEGNARMSSTLPRMHIAVMGMEKLLPDFESLALFLEMLGRSATGQRLTAYTSLLTGARKPEENDGPESLHIVILDNGRSKMLRDPNLREALFCIRCGACMNVCPVYRSIGGHAYGSVYPGPIGSVISPIFHGEARAKAMPYASSLCGACSEICPVGIPLHHQLLSWRHTLVSHGHSRLSERLLMRMFLFMSKRTWRYDLAGAIARALAPLLSESGVPRVPVWSRTRDFPRIPKKSFKQLWKERENEHA